MTAYRAALATIVGLAAGLALTPVADAEAYCSKLEHRQLRAIEVECISPLSRRSDVEVAHLAPTPADQSQRQDSDGDLTTFEYIADGQITLQRPLAGAVDRRFVAQGGGPEDLSTTHVSPDNETGEPAYYLVGAGDQLRIEVWRNPELSTSVTVRPDGRISVPLVEDLYVEGRSPSEVADLIENRLGEFIQDPLVTVVVGGFSGTLSQQVRVLGETAEPRAVPYREGMRIIDVMVATGGLSPFAAGNEALLLRRDGESLRQIPLRLDDLLDDGDSTANIAIQPGDVIVVPEGFFSGDWRFNQSASVTQTYSDNIDRAPEGEENAALITEIGPAWSLDVTTARISGAITSNTQIRQRFLNDPGTELRGSLNGTTTIEFLEEFFFLDASATSSRQTLDTTSSGADSDQSQVTSVRLSPFITQRFGGFAESQFRLDISQTFVESEEVSDDQSIAASFFIGSGRDFNRFRWSISGSASQTGRSEGDEDIIEQQVTINAEYAVTRDFAVLGSVGFEIRDDEGDENDFEEPTWNIGFSWQPGPRTDVQLTYGRRDDAESFQGSFSYQITSRTSLSMSYSEELETPQERLQNDLAALAIDPVTGELVDSRTGEPFDPNTSPFSIGNETTRTRRFSARFSHAKRRDNYAVSAVAEEETATDGGSSGERTIQASASWSRQLHPRANLSVSGSVSQTDRADGEQVDRDFRLGTTFSHQLYSDVNWFASYSHARRISDEALSEFVENLFQLGVSVRF